MAQDLNVSAGAFTGDPAGVVFGRGDFAIESERALQSDERLAGAHEVKETFVEFFRGGAMLGRQFNGDGGGAQTAQSFACVQGIRVFGSDDYFRDTAAISASAQGGVRPVWAQGSSVT